MIFRASKRLLREAGAVLGADGVALLAALATAALSFLLRSFGASNLKRAAFFFDYKEFLANGGTVGGFSASNLYPPASL